ncbi:MAG: hypothetical protein H6Q59_1796 [Firmicutes bacterium]|nr:hypothetical protein [Bacillota bacterium]
MSIRYLTLGAIFAALAAILQLVPFFFSEMFVLVTMLSAIPIYIISRMNPKAGIVAYFVSGFLIILFSFHEGLLFFCTNGIIGASLGSCYHYFQRKGIILLISTFLLTGALITVNYGIGIPVFGGDLPGTAILQLISLLVFSFLYNTFFFFFAGFLYRRLKRIGFIDKLA